MYLERTLLQMAWVGTSKTGERTAQQFMLVLQGGQGLSKTRWLAKLLPAHFLALDYFLDGRSCDLHDKDHLLEQSTQILVEWGEIGSTFKKSGIDQIKSYLTSPVDKIRPPYFHEAVNFKRHMCLCATVNDVEFLADKTGSRRFAIIDCIGIDADHSVDIDGLWAQVATLMKRGTPYWFTKDEVAELTERNKAHNIADDLEAIIYSLYDLSPSVEPAPKAWKSTLDIYSKIDAHKLNHGAKVTQNAITRTLRRLKVKERISHKTPYFCIADLK
jgi:predicted P-loop ATPase